MQTAVKHTWLSMANSASVLYSHLSAANLSLTKKVLIGLGLLLTIYLLLIERNYLNTTLLFAFFRKCPMKSLELFFNGSIAIQ
ncbi:MAG: hypothetical protein VR65_25710 [Desulfobulbaceae bacterium BRH_c16a]|nr:MAG: hypothetical protein VR65_25710 [Desulfobulbaceae bacterium BRH_c16a]